jgi:16S rRNA (guanine(966)-N(2))-methyltransferase RsmD
MRSGAYLTGGTAKGAKLFSVPGRDVRPATSRVRISLFEILRSRLPGATAVDLFAGTGSLGLEALSRGAAFCTFFDTDERCVEVLRRNLEKLRLTDRAEVRAESAFRAADVLRREVDLVFVDPPYAFYDDRREEMERLVSAWARGSLLRPEGRILVERRPRQELKADGVEVVDEREYGGTVVTFYVKKR